MNYQFLLGRVFEVDGHTFLVSALNTANGETIVRASARIAGEQVMRVYPADFVLHHLVVDEEITLRGVCFC